MLLAISDLAFHQRLGRLIEKLDRADFWPALAGFLGEVADFDTWVAMLFRPGQCPQVLADKGANYSRADLFADYRSGMYLLDPFYTFCQGEVDAGVYRLDEVAPDLFRDTEYFKRYFSLNVVEDEVQFLLPLPGQGVLSLSLGSQRRFSADEVGSLCLFAPWLLPLMRQGAGIQASTGARTGKGAGARSGLEQALRKRAHPHLTDREVEVALSILAGHSTKGVASQLGISLDTAKVHRRNLYGKLKVTTQAGLFLLFMGEESRPVDLASF